MVCKSAMSAAKTLLLFSVVAEAEASRVLSSTTVALRVNAAD